MEAVWTRRAFLASIPAALTGEIVPVELKRFRDGATEFEVIRLTEPDHPSRLPPAHLRPVSRNNMVLFCADRGQGMQPYRLEGKTGEIRPVLGVSNIDVSTLTHTPDDRGVVAWDDAGFWYSSAGSVRPRSIYKLPSNWSRGGGFTLTDDGRFAWVETNGGESRIRLIGLRGNAITVLESNAAAGLLARPRSSELLYRRGGDAYLVRFDGARDRKLKLAEGRIGPALWRADGRTLLYLLFPDNPAILNQIREHTPETGEDRLVAPTSQFVSFARNSDSSVFVGVSRSKPSPHILLLLRKTRREFTLCEHRASDPNAVPIVFSPNSQRIFFETDRHGQPCIYSMIIDRLVEETLEESDRASEPRA